MANQTIYPYGTNGELPSSIGLIDDLITGGRDKALTAEQGKVLNENLEEIKDNFLMFSKIASVPWVTRVASGTNNFLSVLDSEDYSCSLTVKSVSSGSRFALDVRQLEVGQTYKYEFYLFKRENGEDEEDED